MYPTFRVGGASPAGSAAYIGRVGVLAVALGIGLAGATGFALPQAHADEGPGVNASDAPSGQADDHSDAGTPAAGATAPESSADSGQADAGEPETKDASDPDADGEPSAGKQTPAAGRDEADEAVADQTDPTAEAPARHSPRSQSRTPRSARLTAPEDRQDTSSTDASGRPGHVGRPAEDATADDQADSEVAAGHIEFTRPAIPVIDRTERPVTAPPKTPGGEDTESDDGFTAVVTKAIRNVLAADATSGPGSTADAALMLALLAWTRRETNPEAAAAAQGIATAEALDSGADVAAESYSVVDEAAPEEDGTSEGDAVAPMAFMSARTSITVTATSNEAPTAVNDTKTIVEDTPRTFAAIELTANDTDPEHNTPLTLDSVADAVGGTAVLNGDGTVTFTPATNFNGAASFTYRVKDALDAVSANSATVTVNVLGVNDAPTAVADTVSPNAARSYTFTAAQLVGNDTDPDAPYGDSVSIGNVGNATGGTVVRNADGTVTFTPTVGLDGSGSFTYTAKDSKGAASAAATVTITPVNQAPTAVNDTKTIVEDTPRTFAAIELTANDTDPEHNTPFTLDSVGNAVGGTAVLNGDGTVTFTPATNFNGAASFTYRVKDAFGAVSANSATVTVNVLGVNDAPTAVADTVSPNAARSYTFTAAQLVGNDTDPDAPYGDSVSIGNVGNATGGTVVRNADGTVTFTPTVGLDGSGSFTYTAKDSKGAASAAATVTITPVNQAPTAVNDTKTIVEDTPRTFAAIELTANDTDPENNTPFTLDSVGNAVGGTAVLNGDGTVTFTPATNFNGEASFTYRVKDAFGAVSANSAVVTVNVLAEDDVPVAGDDAYTTNEDTPLTVSLANGLLANDSDVEEGDLTAVLVDGPAHGSLLLNDDGTFTYTPNANFAGTDVFTYAASDVEDEWGYATVTINVTPVNDAPVAVNNTYTTSEDTALTVNVASGVVANDTDVDGDTLTASVVAGPSHGTLTLNGDGSFTYTPTANWFGADSFTYKVNDGVVDSNTATVSITVNPVNDAPVAVNDSSYSTNEDTALTITAPGVLGNDTDIDGNTLTAVLVTGPSKGTVTLNADGSFTYAPNLDANGADSFTYKVNDGTVDSNVATVSITITAVNDAPVANNNTYTTNEDTPLVVNTFASGVLGNDTDADANTLTASVVSGPTLAQGTLAFNPNGTFTFTPTANYNGVVTFTYKVNDGTVDSNVATVTINVTSVNDAPVATGQSYTAWYNYGIPGRYKIDAGDLRDHASDVETPDSGLTWVLVSGPTKTSGLGGNGTLTWAGNGTFTYNTDDANIKTVQFTYRVTDPSGASSATVTVVISTSL